MKKILTTLATLVLLSYPIVNSINFSEMNTKRQILQTNNSSFDTNYDNLDLFNFQSVLHQFDFGGGTSDTLNPTIADVNVNIASGGDIYNEIAQQLDQRLSNIYAELNIENKLQNFLGL